MSPDKVKLTVPVPVVVHVALNVLLAFKPSDDPSASLIAHPVTGPLALTLTPQAAALTLTETDRDSLASNDVLINRRAFVVHPAGMKFIGTPTGATPSDTELKTGTNWTRTSEIKNMGIVQVKAKIGTVATPETPETPES